MTVLSDTLAEAARRFPARRALVLGDATITYRELDALATAGASRFGALGVRAGDVVALVLPTSLEYVVAYGALARLGAIATGISPRYRPDEQARVLDIADPRLVVTTANLPDFSIGEPIETETAPAPAPTDPDAVETIVFTSGTTGTPKGAVFTSRQIAAITAMDTGGAWGSGGAQVVSTGLPHVGFMTKLAGNVQLGLTMHLLSRWRAADVLEIVERERIRIIGGVAAHIALMLRVPDFDRYDLTCVEGLVVGAGPSPAAVVREARRRFGAGYSIRYSSTESGGVGTLTAFDAPDDEALHTVGRRRPGIDLVIKSVDDGGVVPNGRVGEVCLRSPAVMDRYWRDDDATATAIDGDRFLHTGDLGWVGDDGCLRLTGRIKELYIRGGYNVYPLEVEGVLLDHPDVAAVAVVPRPDPVMGEIGVAVVVPRPPGGPPSLEDLRAFAAERLAAYKLPEAMRVVDAIPLTAMDKVDRRALTAREAAEVAT